MHRPVLAAGGIIWRRAEGSNALEVLLVRRPRYDDWTFPKGKLHRDEALLAAAVREVAEETGLSVVVGQRMGTVSYLTVDGPKEVTYWTMQPAGGNFRANAEVDTIRWVPVARAADVLSYDHDKLLADELADQPPNVVRVILVRHAVAQRRGEFAGPDEARPLVARGRRQADELVSLLNCFGPTRVLSAPAQRCVQTVEPFARSAGISVETDPMFGEEGFAEDPRAAVDRLASALASRVDVTVIASQGGVIPTLLSQLSLSGAPEPTGQIAGKAGAWALASGSGPVRGDYYPPPTLVGG